MRKAESTAKVRPIQKLDLLHLSGTCPVMVELYSELKVQLMAPSESIKQAVVDVGQSNLITVPKTDKGMHCDCENDCANKMRYHFLNPSGEGVRLCF